MSRIYPIHLSRWTGTLMMLSSDWSVLNTAGLWLADGDSPVVWHVDLRCRGWYPRSEEYLCRYQCQYRRGRHFNCSCYTALLQVLIDHYLTLDYLSLDSCVVPGTSYILNSEIYSEIIQFVIIILDLKWNSLSLCHYLWLHTLTAALYYNFSGLLQNYLKIYGGYFLILFRLSSELLDSE